MAQSLIAPSGMEWPLNLMDSQGPVYARGLSKSKRPFLIRALSVLKSCLGSLRL